MEDILSLWFFLSPRPLIKTGAKLRARSLDIMKKTEKTTLVSSGEDAKTTLVSSGEDELKLNFRTAVTRE